MKPMRSLAGATLLMFRTHLAGVLRSKRALLCLVLACGPPAIAWAGPRREDAFEVVTVLGMLLLQFLAPFTGLIAGSAVVTEEIENRTITYVFTRPVHRASLFLGRWLATVVLISSLLGGCALGLVAVAQMERPGDERGRAEHRAEVVDGEHRVQTSYVPVDRTLPEGMAGRLVWSAVLAGAVYSLLTAGLGVFFRRPMIVGLGYAFAVEGLLANVPGSSQKLSVQYYLRAIFTDLRDGATSSLGERQQTMLRDFEPIQRTVFLTPADSSVRLLIVAALALAVCTWAITRRQYVLTS